MGRRALSWLLLPMLGAASVAGGASGARFTLGLLGGYQENQLRTDAGDSSTSTAWGGFELGLSGTAFDPRFLNYWAALAGRVDATEQTEGDSDRTILSYAGGFRLFTNRMISLSADLGHSDSDVESTVPRPSLVGGERDNLSGSLRFRPSAAFGSLELTHSQMDFVADETGSLLDESRRRSEARYRSSLGLSRDSRGMLELEAAHEETELFDHQLIQEFDDARALLDLHFGDQASWNNLLWYRHYRQDSNQSGFGPWSTEYRGQSLYRHRLADSTQLNLRADLQSLRIDGGDGWDSWGARVGLVHELSPTLLLDVDAGYLDSSGSTADESLRQPSAAVGLSWSPELRHWRLTVGPSLTYAWTSGGDQPDSSSLAASLFVNAWRQLPKGHVLLEAEHATGRLDFDEIVTPDDDTPPIVEPAGLDRTRQRLRLSYVLQARPRLRINAMVEGSRTDSESPEGSTSSDAVSASAGLSWSRFAAQATHSTSSSGTMEADVDSSSLSLAWSLLRWLSWDARVQRDRRRFQETESTTDDVQTGLSLLYGRLELFVRARENEVSSGGGSTRRDRELRVGVRRSFDFRVGR